jgi:RHS repeat-associated protein
LLPFVPAQSRSMTAPEMGRTKSVRVYLNPNTGRFWTMDTFAGNNQDPLSLHKYLYATDNPVNQVDPSGHDSGNAVAVGFLGKLIEYGFYPIMFESRDGNSTCGPDVTTAVMKTMRDVKQTYDSAPSDTKKEAIWHLLKHPIDTLESGFDMDKLFYLGIGGDVNFGNGSSLGTGLGVDTVQFSYNGPKVYRAGSVNYIIWGELMALSHSYYPHDPLFSENAALAAARGNKLLSQHQLFADYADEAVAFTGFGYSYTELGYSTWDPSYSAMKLTPNPNNKASSARFKWRWLGLHNTFE